MISRLYPVAERRADIEERIAERRHLPVENSEDVREIVRIEDEVVVLVVVMHERRRDRRRRVRRNPRDERIHRREIVGAGVRPALAPARDLSRHIALGLAEPSDRRIGRTDGMNRDERIDKRRTQQPHRAR